MDTHAILVCAASHQWTLEALHLASSLSLDTGWPIELLKLVSVDNPYMLGVDDASAYRHYTPAEHEQVMEYIRTLDDYGVRFTTDLFQYVSHVGAIVDAAEQYNAPVVFATLPHYLIPLWRRFDLWNLRRQLAHQNRTLYTLENALDALVWPLPGRPIPTYEHPVVPISEHHGQP